jgi:hypothetical protein
MFGIGNGCPGATSNDAVSALPLSAAPAAEPPPDVLTGAGCAMTPGEGTSLDTSLNWALE